MRKTRGVIFGDLTEGSNIYIKNVYLHRKSILDSWNSVRTLAVHDYASGLHECKPSLMRILFTRRLPLQVERMVVKKCSKE